MALSDFYRSDAWVKLRRVIINDRLNDKGESICVHCGKPIVRKYDLIAHHKVPLTESNYKDAMIALNPSNIELVHHKCHNLIHNKLGYVERQVYLVYGSPLSGKTTWIQSNAQHGDLIVDIDKVWQCISGQETYIKPSRLTDITFGVRDYLIDCIRVRRGSWCNAYVVGGYPLIGERERLIKMLGAREIYIEATKDECLARLKQCKDNRNKSDWQKYIEAWWARYHPPL